jgi:hypothetical protein
MPAAGLRGLYPGRNMQLWNGGLPIVAATRRERLTEIYRRLALAAPAASGTDALDLIALTMNQVEDQLSGVRFDPENWKNDGRLYPPQPDSLRMVAGRPDVTRFRSRGHNTWIRSNGAFEIRTLEGDVEFAKPGADGQGVEL